MTSLPDFKSLKKLRDSAFFKDFLSKKVRSPYPKFSVREPGYIIDLPKAKTLKKTEA